LRYQIIIIFLFLFYNSCGIKLGRNDRERRNLPSATMRDFLYTYTAKTGFREWEVKSAQANIYEDSDDVYLYNLTMTFFSESNQIKSVLVANKGIVNQKEGNLMSRGEVHILSSNRSELLTEEVYWDQDREVFYSKTNKLVTFIRPRQKIIGYNMVSDSQLENVELDNSVGKINTEDINNNSTKKDSTSNKFDQGDEFNFIEENI